MKNKYYNNLKLSPFNFKWLSNNVYDYDENYISVTELLNDPRQIILQRRHHDEIKRAVSEIIWALDGTALHVHRGNIEHKNVIHGFTIKTGDLPYYQLKGTFDLIEIRRQELIIDDLKKTSIYTYKKENREDDHIKQVSMYIWLLGLGDIIKKGRITYYIRDWMPRYKKNIPAQIIEKYFDILPMSEIENYIIDKTKNVWLLEQAGISDNELPECKNTWDGRKKCKLYCAVRKICKYGEKK